MPGRQSNKLNANPIKVLMVFYTEMEKPSLKFTWDFKGHQRVGGVLQGIGPEFNPSTAKRKVYRNEFSPSVFEADVASTLIMKSNIIFVILEYPRGYYILCLFHLFKYVFLLSLGTSSPRDKLFATVSCTLLQGLDYLLMFLHSVGSPRQVSSSAYSQG
jgi:hypothetical protein